MNIVERGWMERILAYARAHYSRDGWDFIVECWGVEEFTNFFAQITYIRYSDAFNEVRQVARILHERRRETQSW